MTSNTNTRFQPGNQAAVGHGAPRGSRNGGYRHGLSCGAMPKGNTYVRNETNRLRRFLETAVADRNDGEVSLYHACVIQSCVRHERHAMLATRWLREHSDTMDHNEKLAYSREIGKASAERDRCLRLLQLDQPDMENSVDALYSFEARSGPLASDLDEHAQLKKLGGTNMDILSAHAEFAKLSDDQLVELLGGPIQGEPATMPLYCTAYALLSDQLDGCESLSDLQDALRHGVYLTADGVKSSDEFVAAFEKVQAEVMRWGYQEEERRKRPPLI